MLPLLWVSLSFLLGLTRAASVPLSPAVWLGLAAATLLWHEVVWRLKRSAN